MRAKFFLMGIGMSIVIGCKGRAFPCMVWRVRVLMVIWVMAVKFAFSLHVLTDVVHRSVGKGDCIRAPVFLPRWHGLYSGFSVINNSAEWE